MQIDITALITSPGFDPWDLSNSRANLGQDAGAITWDNCLALNSTTLDTEEKCDAFRDFVRDSGGWTQDEILIWPDAHLNALFAQWVAGDIREGLGDDLPDDPAEWPWEEYEEKAERGSVSSNLSHDGGNVHFYLGC